MKKLALLLAVIGFGLGACERHEWESKPGKAGTEKLFEHAPVDDDKGHEKEGEKSGKEEKAH